MINKKLILENAIRFGFVNELKKSKKNQSMIDYAVKLGFAIDQGDEVVFPWNKTGNPTYETWLLNQLKDPQHMQKGLVNFQEDGNKLEEFISEFDRLKKQRQISGIDINQLDFSGVKRIVADNEQKISRKAMERGDVDVKTKSGYELKIFKDVGDAEEVANIGQETHWCTKGIKTAESYLSKGAIYIVFKNGEPYVQLHIETKQYMDKNDSPISESVWQELRQNIPFINQLVNRMRIIEGMNLNELDSLFDENVETFKGDFNYRYLYGRGISQLKLVDFILKIKSVTGDFTITDDPFYEELDNLEHIGGNLIVYAVQSAIVPKSIKTIDGSFLMKNGGSIAFFPKSLERIGRDLHYKWSRLKELNNSLKYIGGDLFLNGSTRMERLPNSLEYVGGELNLEGAPITELPDSLVSVGGNFNLRYTKITKLPDSLVSVDGDLELKKIKIKELPISLKYIGGYLDIRGTGIKELPKNLVVKGIILRD